VTRAAFFRMASASGLSASEAGHGQRAYITDLSGPSPGRNARGARHILVIAGRSLLFQHNGRREARLYPIAGPASRAALAGRREVWPVVSADGRECSSRTGPSFRKVYRIDWRTGRREFIREIRPSDQAGVDNRR